MPRKNTIEIVIKGEDRASGVLKKIGGAVGTLGKAAMYGLGALAAAGGVAGAAMAKLAIDAAPLEGIEKAFEGIAEASGKSADEMLRALEKGSAGMIAQRDLMKSYNLAAQLVGDQFANQLPEAMGYLGKVAAATGEDMGFMMDSLVRGVGRLSPMILDNLGIQVDLTAAYEAYASSIGKSVEELTKQEQQTALMNQVMEKLAANTANMPEVAGTAAAGIAALRAKFKNLKDSVGKALLPALTHVLNALTKLADKVFPLIVKFVESKVVPAIESLVKAFKFFTDEILPALQDRFRKVWDWITGVAIPKLLDLGSTLLNHVMPVFIFFRDKVLRGLFNIAAALWDWFTDTAIPTLKQLGAVIWDKLIDALSWLKDNIMPAVQGSAAKLWDWITGTAIPKLKEWAKAIWERVGPAFEFLKNEVLPALLGVAQKIWDWIASVAIPKLKEWGGAIIDYLAPHFNKFKDEILPALWGAAKDVWDWITRTAIPKLKEWAQTVRDEVGDAIEKFTTKTLPGLLQKAEDVWDGVTKAISSAWDGLKPKLTEIKDMIVEQYSVVLPGVQRAWEKFKNLLNEMIQPFSLLTDPTMADNEQQWRDIGSAIGELLKLNIGEWFELTTTTLTTLNVTLELATPLISAVSKAVVGLITEVEWLIQRLTKGNEELGKFGAWLRDVAKAFIFLGPVIAPVKLAMDALLNVVRGLIDLGLADAITSLATSLQGLGDILADMWLPSWLRPGSPTPFEEGIRGITDAMGDLNAATAGLGMTPAGGAALGGAGVAAGGGGGDQAVFYKMLAELQELVKLGREHGVVVVETGRGNGDRARDHILGLEDRAWGLMPG
jgi:phage-related protein